MHADGLGPAAERGDRDKHVVERGNQQDGQPEYEHHLGHHLHPIGLTVGFGQRGEEGGIAILLAVLVATVLINHGLHTAVDRLHVRTGAQSHILKPAVASLPGVVEVLLGKERGHGIDHIGMDGGVSRHILEDTTHGDVADMPLVEALAHGVLIAKHPSGHGLTQESGTQLLQLLYGVAAQHPDA